MRWNSWKSNSEVFLKEEYRTLRLSKQPPLCTSHKVKLPETFTRNRLSLRFSKYLPNLSATLNKPLQKIIPTLIQSSFAKEHSEHFYVMLHSPTANPFICSSSIVVWLLAICGGAGLNPCSPLFGGAWLWKSAFAYRFPCRGISHRLMPVNAMQTHSAADRQNNKILCYVIWSAFGSIPDSRFRFLISDCISAIVKYFCRIDCVGE